MRIDHLRAIHAVHMVRAEHADVIRLLVAEQVQVLVHRVRRALEPALAQSHLRGHAHHVVAEQRGHAPGGGDVPIQAVALVLGEHGNAAHAGIDQVAQRKVDQAVVGAKRHCGLTAIPREGHEPFALATGEDDSEYVGALDHAGRTLLRSRTMGNAESPQNRSKFAVG